MSVQYINRTKYDGMTSFNHSFDVGYCINNSYKQVFDNYKIPVHSGAI